MLFESSKEEDCQSQATKDVSDSTSSPNPKIGPALAVAVSNIEKAKEEE
jgi:inner membrane protein involved in colicin E2 resistance